jgi:transposase
VTRRVTRQAARRCQSFIVPNLQNVIVLKPRFYRGFVHWNRLANGRKPIPTRRVLEAVLWILNTGAQWHMLPQSHLNYKTVHRRFQTWCCKEILRRVLMDVANEFRDESALDEEECFIDATFVMAKGDGAEIGPTKREKGTKIMAIVDRHGLPLGFRRQAAVRASALSVPACRTPKVVPCCRPSTNSNR